MKRNSYVLLMILFFALPLWTCAVDLHFLNSMIASANEPSMSKGLVPLTKEDWQTVNKGRALITERSYSFSQAQTNPAVNRGYFRDQMLILASELRQERGQPPTQEELYVAWRMGKEKFAKLGYDLEKAKRNKKLAGELAKMEKLMQEKYLPAHMERKGGPVFVPNLNTNGIPRRIYRTKETP